MGKVMKKKIYGIQGKQVLLSLLLLSVMIWTWSAGLLTVSANDEAAAVSESSSTTKTKAGWVKIDGYYYWQKANGTIVTSTGFKKLGGKKYYLESGRRKTGLLTVKKKIYYLKPSLVYGLTTVKGNTYYFDETTGAAVTNDWVTIKKKKYYFGSDGCMVKGQWIEYEGQYYYIKKNGVLHSAGKWMTLSTGTYYISKKGYRVTGLKTISGKKYYFLSDGTLVTDKIACEINGTYYTISSEGVATVADTSNIKVECSIKTQEFIAKHTSSDQTNAEKFRKCFNYIIAYTKYVANSPLSNAQAATTTWPYTFALEMLNTNLKGGCYGMASLIASCAKELGYQPYVIAITAQHGFVMIDGKYYDNMGARFGTDEPAIYPYTVRSQIEF
ncbi:MAG: hypothetical protein LUH00_02160 [Lachnospiraceae bacterium]|nr:hypothetical protein [Lachnospiraceae bacterium]